MIHNPAFFFTAKLDFLIRCWFSFFLFLRLRCHWLHYQNHPDAPYQVEVTHLSEQLYIFMKEDHHRSQIADHLHINSRCPGKGKKRGVLKENIQRLLERENRNLLGIFLGFQKNYSKTKYVQQISIPDFCDWCCKSQMSFNYIYNAINVLSIQNLHVGT